MFRNTEHELINSLKESSPETYKLIIDMIENQHKETLSIHHSIKNYIAYISSCYQLISKQHPESNNFQFWDTLGENVDELVNYLDRLAIYNDSLTLHKQNELSISDLIYRIPDNLDDFIDIKNYISKSTISTENINFIYDVSKDIDTLYINADNTKITAAFNEIVINACEACNYNGDITICAYISTTDNNLILSIKNNFSVKDELSLQEIKKSCTSFFSTKNGHAGLGLPIVANICFAHNYKITINCDETNFEANIIIDHHHYFSK